MKIRIIKENDISKIANFWVSNFNENLFSILGFTYIKQYLCSFINFNKNIGFLAYKDEEILGFVLFGSDNEAIYKILQNNFINLILIFFKYLITFNYYNLSKLFDVGVFVLVNILFNMSPNHTNELLIIIVDKKYRSKNIGSKLINHSFQDLKKKNDKLILVKTLARYKKSINFYQKNGFILKKTAFKRYYLLKKII